MARWPACGATRMSRLGAILKNTGYLALAETAKPALSFMLILVISRALGREGVLPAALGKLQLAAASGGNVFAELMECVKVCSLGQISHALYEVGGQYRRNM